MKVEKQQTAIAKVCNNLFFRNTENVWCFMSPKLGVIEWDIDDLNACHEMEKVLTERQMWTYAFTLAQVLDTSPTVDLDDQFLNIHATAAEKCEAFLRTLGLWEEEEQ